MHTYVKFPEKIYNPIIAQTDIKMKRIRIMSLSIANDAKIAFNIFLSD